MAHPKQSTILITLAIVLITILIPLLSNTEFHDGIAQKEDRFTREETLGSFLYKFIRLAEKNRLWKGDSTRPVETRHTLTLLVVFIPITALLIISVILLVSAHVRKKILSILIACFFWLFIFYMAFLFSYNRPTEDHWRAGALIQSEEIPLIGEENEISVQNVPEPEISGGLSYLFSFITILITGGVLILFYRKMRNLKQDEEDVSIKDVTEQALNSISEGSQITDIIISCYNDMVVCLQEERGITRSDSMTAGEFKFKMMNIGLPKDEVEELTSLFERVRYGREPLSEDDEKEAVMCLKSVVVALESGK